MQWRAAVSARAQGMPIATLRLLLEALALAPAPAPVLMLTRTHVNPAALLSARIQAIAIALQATGAT
eukprot:COSAG02_NODE_4925_length_4831_cov_2.178149_9_plen_67_part_00